MRRMRSLAVCGFLLLLLSLAYVAKPLDIYSSCSAWSKYESEACRGCPITGGFEVGVDKKLITHFRYVTLPRDGRYLFDWDIETKSQLICGGVGHSFGTPAEGLPSRSTTGTSPKSERKVEATFVF